jgi:anti-sigma-K factor RskA
MALHEQFADDLTLYALDALAGEERLAIKKHLEECSACRAEVVRLREDFALLALSASGPTPPPRCRERLLDAIRKEPRQMEARPRSRTGWLHTLGWAAAAAAMIAVLWLARQNRQLEGQVATLEAHSAAAQQQLLEARELAALLSSGNAEHFTLVANNTAPQPGGKAIYDAASGALVFFASNMPAVPSRKAYELWLIPANGGAPIPAGVFKPDARGAATVIKPPLPTGLDAKTFAITIEPEAGSPAPTSQPVLVGTRG